jgi:hypothetical protein
LKVISLLTDSASNSAVSASWHAGVLALERGHHLPGRRRIASLGRRLQVGAVPAQGHGADVGAARLERMGDARDLVRVARARGALQFADELGRLGEVEIDQAGEHVRLAAAEHPAQLVENLPVEDLLRLRRCRIRGAAARRRSTPDPAVQDLLHRLHAERLGQMIVHAGAQALFAVVRHGVGGQRDDRHPSSRRLLADADFPRRLVAVHLGHRAVHQE